jgi:hypothetical protein
VSLPAAGEMESGASAESIEPLGWTVHPFRERQGLGYAILAVILGVSFFAATWARSGFWGFFSFAVLFLSLESFYFPTRFLLEEKKLTVFRRFSRSEREWTVFRRCYEDREGITLSPFTKSSWLETYRAIRIRFAPADRERVSGFVRGRLGDRAEWVRDPRWRAGKSAA